MADTPEAKEAEPKFTQGRSPAYPFIPLAKALERAEQVHSARVGRNAYPPGTFYKIWGVGAKSSTARQTMAALNHFGLVEYEGRGDDRKVRLSDLAFKILQDKRPNSPERTASIQKAALLPPIHQKLFQKFPPPQPDDVFVEHFLVNDAGYNASAAEALIDEFKDTLAYAGLDEPDSMPDGTDGEAAEDRQGQPAVKVGDSIQWTSDGVDQFREPALVLDLSEDGKWVFTDQGAAGIPIEEITVVEPAQQNTADPSRTPPPAPPHVLAALEAKANRSMQGDLKEGESVLSRGKLKSGSFEIRVTGEVGAKEIAKIIKVLEAQKEVLEDDS